MSIKVKDGRVVEFLDVEGTLRIDIDKFPLDVLEKLNHGPHSLPLEVCIPMVWITDGSMEFNGDGTFIELNFTALDIEIKEANLEEQASGSSNS